MKINKKDSIIVICTIIDTVCNVLTIIALLA